MISLLRKADQVFVKPPKLFFIIWICLIRVFESIIDSILFLIVLHRKFTSLFVKKSAENIKKIASFILFKFVLFRFLVCLSSVFLQELLILNAEITSEWSLKGHANTSELINL